MYHRSHHNGSDFAMGALTGALVGAGLALLFAPKAGADMRSDLSESVGSLRDAVSRRVRDLADRAGVELENMQDHVDRVTDAVEARAHEVIDNLRDQGRSLDADGRMPRG